MSLPKEILKQVSKFRSAGVFNVGLHRLSGEHRQGGTHADNRGPTGKGVARPGKTAQDKSVKGYWRGPSIKNRRIWDKTARVWSRV